jgi:hypothetical protein
MTAVSSSWGSGLVRREDAREEIAREARKRMGRHAAVHHRW